MFLIYPIGVGTVPSNFIQFLVPVLDVPVPSPHGFGLFPFPTNMCEHESSYIETQTQQIENRAKTVTTNSLFPVHDLV